MKLKTTTFVEHQSAGKQDISDSLATSSPVLLAPGASSTLFGCTCSTCCCCGVVKTVPSNA